MTRLASLASLMVLSAAVASAAPAKPAATSGAAAAPPVAGAPSGAPAAPAATARADVKTRDGKSIGTLVITQSDHGVSVRGELQGIPPGTHAMHLHDSGKCVPPFDTAGPHFNPAKHKHGFQSPQGHHAGDLPNLVVPETGKVAFEALVPGVFLDRSDARLLDADGASIMIHAGADDHKTDPGGGAGDRWACGEVVRATP